MNCEEVRLRLDDFIARLIPDEDAARIETHLISCADCAATLANRKALSARVRAAVRSVEAPPDLGHRVQFAIARAGTPRKPFANGYGKGAMALAAALLIAAGAFYFRPAGDSDPPKETQEQFIARLSTEVTPLMRVGLSQHVHCGVFREYPAMAPALTELAHDKAVSAALIDAVETHAPAGLHVVMAHRCSYRGREFTHVVARGNGRLMSLLIVRRTSGEAFESDLKAVATQPDMPMYASLARSGADTFAVNAFETQNYLVFLVSDVAPADNLTALEAMTPQVRAALL